MKWVFFLIVLFYNIHCYKNGYDQGYAISFAILFSYFLFIVIKIGDYIKRKKFEREYNKYYSDYDYYDDDDYDSYNEYNYKNNEPTTIVIDNKYTKFKKDFENYCYLLGVNEDCTLEDVKKKYLQLSKIYHPDQNRNSKANEKFLEIKEAYEFLNEENFAKYKFLEKNF